MVTPEFIRAYGTQRMVGGGNYVQLIQGGSWHYDVNKEKE